MPTVLDELLKLKPDELEIVFASQKETGRPLAVELAAFLQLKAVVERHERAQYASEQPGDE